MYIKEILLENTPKTLYHGTIKNNLESIMTYGLEPNVGEFTRDAYWEYENEGIELPLLLFAADKSGLRKCISAIYGAMKSNGIKITPENFLKHAAIVVFKEGEDYFDHRHEDEMDHHYATVEPGDYYREYNLVPDYYLTGKKLLRFLRNHGVGLSYGFGNLDDNGKKSGTIKNILRLVPDMNKSNLLKMSADELNQLLIKLKYKN